MSDSVDDGEEEEKGGEEEEDEQEVMESPRKKVKSEVLLVERTTRHNKYATTIPTSPSTKVHLPVNVVLMVCTFFLCFC